MKELIKWLEIQNEMTIQNERVFDKYTAGLKDAFEGCLAMAKHCDKNREPNIICLSMAKHYRIRPNMTAKRWILSLVKKGNRNDKFVAQGETYWEAERKAIEFLNTK